MDISGNTYAIHLRSIFAHIDAYVDRWRLQYEGGDAPKHVVELGLVLVPNEDLCRLLFTCLKSCCRGLEVIGLKTVDLTIRDGGCLNKISMDVETLERERRNKEVCVHATIYCFGKIHIFYPLILPLLC